MTITNISAHSAHRPAHLEKFGREVTYTSSVRLGKTVTRYPGTRPEGDPNGIGKALT